MAGEEDGPWNDYAPEPAGPWDDYAPNQQAVTPPPAFLQRLRDGVFQKSAMQRAMETGFESLTQGTLGVDNWAPDTKKWFQDHGFILDYTQDLPSGWQGSLRYVSDKANRTLFEGLDAINRLMSVPGAAARGWTEQFLLNLNPDANETSVKKQGAAAEEFLNLAQVFAGTEPGSLHITRVGPMGEVRDVPVSRAMLPGPEDFQLSARDIAGGPLAPHVEAKLRQLYEERGLLPAEVAADAGFDPSIKQALISVGDDLPDAYGGERARFGGGGEKPPGEGGGGVPLEPLPEGSYEAARKSVLDHLSIGENPKVGPSSYVDEAYRSFVEKFYPIKRVTEEGGLKLGVADDPYKLASLFGGIGGKVDVALNRYMFDFHGHEKVGPSLKAILAPIRGELDDFRAFLASARALELESRGVKTGFDLDAARMVGKHRTAQFEKTAKELYEYQRQVAQYARDAGLLSRKGYEEMVHNNRLYVPFHALMDVEKRGIPGVSEINLQSRQPFHKIKGSDRVKIDPLESIIKNTFTIMANADKNNVGVKLIDALLAMQPTELKKATGRDLIVVKPEPRDLDVAVNESIREAQSEALGSSGKAPSELVDLVKHAYVEQKAGEISIFRDGKRTTYEVDPELAEAFRGMDAPAVGDFTRFVLAPFARMLRAGAVLTPDFVLRHILRDQVYASATYKGAGKFHPIDMARGLAGMIMGTFGHKGELGTRFVDWMRDGGGQVGLMALDRDYLQMNLQSLTEDPGLLQRSWNVVAKPSRWLPTALHPLQVANEWATSASHLGAYIKHMRALERDRATAKPPGPETGSALVVTGQRQPGGLVNIDTPENLPAHLKGDLILRPDVDLSEGMKAFKQHVTDAEWKDVPTSAKDAKRDRLEAAWISRDTSVDVARMGARTRGWNQASAFFNSKIQDVDSWMRAIAINPVSTLAVLGGMITLPSVLTWYANKDNQRVQDLPRWQKDVFWIFPKDNWVNTTETEVQNLMDAGGLFPDEVRISNGQLQRNDQILFRYPKPFAAGVIFGTSVERLLDAFVAEKPDAFKGFGTALTESTAGDLLPTMVVPMIEQATNKSRMTGRNIVPAPMEGVLPEYQYTPYTTELAKKLGGVLGAVPGAKTIIESVGPVGKGVTNAVSSPILIENYVRGWTGNVGMYVLKALDKAGTAAGLLEEQTHAPGTLADVPVVKAFIARYPGSSQAVQDFYDNYAEMKPYRDTFDLLKKSGDIEGMMRVREQGGEEAFAKMDGVKQALGRQYTAIKMVDAADEKEIPKDQKRQLIDVIFFQMTQTAKFGNEAMRSIKENSE